MKYFILFYFLRKLSIKYLEKHEYVYTPLSKRTGNTKTFK